MAIQGNLEAKLLIGVANTTVKQALGGRIDVTFASLKNTTVDTVTVKLYKSSSATPAVEDDLIWSKKFASGDSVVPAELLTTIPENGYLVAIADGDNKVNINISYTQYTGED